MAVRFIFSSILQILDVDVRISGSISESPVDFENESRLYLQAGAWVATRVDYIFKPVFG